MTNRQPQGTPVGGQFTEGRKPDGGDLAALSTLVQVTCCGCGTTESVNLGDATARGYIAEDPDTTYYCESCIAEELDEDGDGQTDEQTDEPDDDFWNQGQAEEEEWSKVAVFISEPRDDNPSYGHWEPSFTEWKAKKGGEGL